MESHLWNCFQVEKVNKFTGLLVEKLRTDLTKLQNKTLNVDKDANKDSLNAVSALHIVYDLTRPPGCAHNNQQ
jgi:hypothetical protein